MFLANGTAEGIVTAELSNWNGETIKIPIQKLLLASAKISSLLCKEKDDSGSVYIGEAENVLNRLEQHLQEYKAGKEKHF